MKRVLLFFAVSFFATLSAQADFSNYNSILIGDQAAGMGGAATAMTSDVSAMAYYNPAGLAFLEGRSFSAAVGVYKKFDRGYGQEDGLAQAPLRINQGFFQALPSSLGNIVRYNDYTLGLSIVVPDYDMYKGDLTSSAQNTTTLSFLDQSLWVGGAVATKLTEDSSLGLTLYYTARSYDRTLSDQSFPSTNTATLYNSEKILVQNAIVAILGYHLNVTPDWSFGISLRSPNITVKGQGSYTQSVVSTNPYSATNINEPNLDSTVHIPGKLTAGLAYQWDDSLIIALDGSFYQALNYTDFSDPSYSTHYIQRSIWNGSLGLEKRVYPWLKARVGWFTNFSSVPDPDPSQVPSQPEHIDQLGFSANLAFTSSERIEYTFGGYYTGGRGRAVQQVNQQLETLPLIMSVFTMLVGTSFLF